MNGDIKYTQKNNLNKITKKKAKNKLKQQSTHTKHMIFILRNVNRKRRKKKHCVLITAVCCVSWCRSLDNDNWINEMKIIMIRYDLFVYFFFVYKNRIVLAAYTILFFIIKCYNVELFGG